MACPECSDENLPDIVDVSPSAKVVLCQFLGYDDCRSGHVSEISDSENEQSDDDGMPPRKHREMVGDRIRESAITINHAHRGVHHASHAEITSGVTGEWITGPDGGFYHYWKCRGCNKIHSFTDK
jgi:hypothetical protein